MTKWKYCPMCTQAIPITEFRMTNKSMRSICRLCENELQRRRYREKKEEKMFISYACKNDE